MNSGQTWYIDELIPEALHLVNFHLHCFNTSNLIISSKIYTFDIKKEHPNALNLAQNQPDQEDAE